MPFQMQSIQRLNKNFKVELIRAKLVCKQIVKHKAHLSFHISFRK